ncbi:MAG: hypothetical protein U9Q03_05285 [Patescibacteria group bacterium]|nr:hypothetical protein [Patescibacteria group bacterium]
MSKLKKEGGSLKTRVGWISRVDFGEEGFRTALLWLAKVIFKRADVHFVVLAAGLVAAKAVRETRRKIKAKQRRLKSRIMELTRNHKAREKKRKEWEKRDRDRWLQARRAFWDAEDELAKLPDEAPKKQRNELEAKVKAAKSEKNKRHGLLETNNGRRYKEADRGQKSHDTNVTDLEDRIYALSKDLDDWEPENMAAFLAKAIPEFVNRAGERVNLYIVPSEAFDGIEGIETARELQRLREDIRIYGPNRDIFPMRGDDGKKVEVIVPEKATWMRSEYFATPVQRVLTDRKGLADGHPDIYAVAGFGSSMVKPQGEFPRPWFSVPALHEITGVRTSENQIGVAVTSIHPDHTVPLVTFHSLKDEVNNERDFIGLPKQPTTAQRSLIAALKDLGDATTGTLADRTGLTEDQVTSEMQSMAATSSHSRNTKWPGVIWDKEDRRWKFPMEWMQQKLRYPVPPKEMQKDVVMAYACLHGGSVMLDIGYFLKHMPQRILDHDATILVGAGDFVEGLAHNLAQRGEVHPAFWNLRLQEELSGTMVAKVTLDVFRARFPAALERFKERIGKRKLSNKEKDRELHVAIDEALLQNVMIEGNHDEWVKRHGVQPMIHMRSVMVNMIRKVIEKDLDKHDMRTVNLDEIVERKTIILPCGDRYILPSGLKMSVDHPHMSRTKTTSIRAQAGLAQNSDAHLVILANFHVGIAVMGWDGERGQRVCLQVGTQVIDSDFEHKKQKTVDHGFAIMILESRKNRVVRTTTTFYGHKPGEGKGLDAMGPFDDLMAKFGLAE